MGLTEIRIALANNLASIPNLNQSPYLLANLTPPCAEIEPGEIEYDLTMDRGWDKWTLRIRVLVGVSTDQGAQKTLDRMLAPSGAYSVKAAVEADDQLGGACDDLRVIRSTGYRIYAREGMPALLGAEWEVEVFATPD